MKVIGQKKIGMTLRSLAIAAILSVLFASMSMSPIRVSASTVSSLQQQQAAAKAAQAAAKAAAAAQAAQAAQISAAITSVTSQINSAQSALDDTNNQIVTTQGQVDSLNTQIAQAQDDLTVEQGKLSDVISSWYMQGQSGLLEAMISANSLSDVVNQQQYFDSVRQQIADEMDRINKMKSDLASQKTDLQNKLTQLDALKNDQLATEQGLQYSKTLKGQLLSSTNEAVSALNTQAAMYGQQIAALQSKIDEISAASIGAGGDVVSGAPTSWYYSQGYGGGQPWSDYKMGYYATIGTYGCLLTSLTMVADFYGANYNPQTAAQVSIFVHSWGRLDGALTRTPIVSDGGSKPIDWNTWNIIDAELAANHPVIVGVALGVDMGNSYGVSHFVVLTSKMSNGKYAMQDPLGPGRGYSKSQVRAMRIISP